MGKAYSQPEHDEYCDGSTTYNYHATKAAAHRTSGAEGLETDYSIPGKKRRSYKEQGD